MSDSSKVEDVKTESSKASTGGGSRPDSAHKRADSGASSYRDRDHRDHRDRDHRDRDYRSHRNSGPRRQGGSKRQSSSSNRNPRRPSYRRFDPNS